MTVIYTTTSSKSLIAGAATLHKQRLICYWLSRWPHDLAPYVASSFSRSRAEKKSTPADDIWAN